MSNEPTFQKAIFDFIAAQLSEVRISLPGRVTRYDASRQLADVKPLIKEAFTDEDGERQVESLPVVPNVPVLFPGAGGFRVTFPVKAGDTCLLVFSASSLDVWLSEGGEVDPNFDNKHSLTDAIAIVGLRDFKNPLGNAPTDRMSLGFDDGASIEIDENEVRLGANTGVNFVAIAAKVEAELTALKNAYNAHVHPTAPAGPVSPPSVIAGAVGSTASANVKAKV